MDYEPVAIKSDVRMNGVFLKEGETVARVDTDAGQKALDQLEDEREHPAADIERAITVPDSNRKIIEESPNSEPIGSGCEGARNKYRAPVAPGRFLIAQSKLKSVPRSRVLRKDAAGVWDWANWNCIHQ